MRFLIHFGFPKTASSTLQFSLFQPLHDSGELSLSTWRMNDKLEHLDRRISSRLFLGKAPLEDSFRISKEKLNVISDESLTAPLRLRQNNYGPDISDPFSFPKTLRDYILNRFGQDSSIRALVVLRNHPDLLFSQYVEEYNLKRFKNIDLLRNASGELDLTGFGIYNFHRYIQELEAVFGERNVTVLFYEELRDSPLIFASQVGSLLECSPERVLGRLSANPKNVKQKTSSGYLTGDGEHSIPYLTSHEVEEIKSYFGPDTAQLQNGHGSRLDLRRFGYL